MQLDEDIKVVLKDINFLNRYEDIVNKYEAQKLQEKFKPKPEDIKNIICDLGYESSYDKNENFYKILVTSEEFKYQLNIVIVYSTVQFVWHFIRGERDINLGWGTWESIIELMRLERYTKRPFFYSNQDLMGIIKEGIRIFEDLISRLETKESPAS